MKILSTLLVIISANSFAQASLLEGRWRICDSLSAFPELKEMFLGSFDDDDPPMPASSFEYTLVFNNGQVGWTQVSYQEVNCQGASSTRSASGTYSAGPAVEYPVGAFALDAQLKDNLPEMEHYLIPPYTIYTVRGNSLYFGGLTDWVHNGMTPEKRPLYIDMTLEWKKQ